ncbi:hypothetical protein DD596_25160, partial [Enterobacter cloacae complex sp. 4DZ3-28B]
RWSLSSVVDILASCRKSSYLIYRFDLSPIVLHVVLWTFFKHIHPIGEIRIYIFLIAFQTRNR